MSFAYNAPLGRKWKIIEKIFTDCVVYCVAFTQRTHSISNAFSILLNKKALKYRRRFELEISTSKYSYVFLMLFDVEMAPWDMSIYLCFLIECNVKMLPMYAIKLDRLHSRYYQPTYCYFMYCFIKFNTKGRTQTSGSVHL